MEREREGKTTNKKNEASVEESRTHFDESTRKRKKKPMAFFLLLDVCESLSSFSRLPYCPLASPQAVAPSRSETRCQPCQLLKRCGEANLARARRAEARERTNVFKRGFGGPRRATRQSQPPLLSLNLNLDLFFSLSSSSSSSTLHSNRQQQTLPVVAPESPLAGLFGDSTFADIDIVAFEVDECEFEEEKNNNNNPKQKPSSSSSSSSFAAHRAVLAAASPYFRSMFSSGFAESRTRTVEIKGVSPPLLELLLKFCYGGRLAAVPRAELLPLASLADRLDVPALRAAVDQAIDRDLGPSTAAEYAAAAAAMRDAGCCFQGGGGGGDDLSNNHGAVRNNAREALLDRCLDALCSEFSAAAAEPAFLALNESTLASVLEREDLVAASEAEVFDAVCRWALAGSGGGSGSKVSSRLARRNLSNSSSSSSSLSSSAFERLCRRVRFGSMAPADLAAAAANPLALSSSLVQGMVLRAFVHIHAPRKPPSADGGAGEGSEMAHSSSGNDAAAAAQAAAHASALAAAALALEEDDDDNDDDDGMEEDYARTAAAAAAALSPATPPLDHLEPLAAADEQQQPPQRRQPKAPSSQNLLSFRGDSVSLPPRGGAGARLRLRVVVADGACSWPLDPTAPPCPPGRHCGCPPAMAGAPPRGLSLTMPRDASVRALKLRACRDLGLDPGSFSLFDFYNGQKYGRGALCEDTSEGGEASGNEAGGEGGVVTCGAADLRDGQLVLLELRR